MTSLMFPSTGLQVLSAFVHFFGMYLFFRVAWRIEDLILDRGNDPRSLSVA